MNSITTLYLLLLLGFFSQLHAQVPPCSGNPQGTGGICIGDTFEVTSSGANCTTCSYAWTHFNANLIAGGGPNDTFARFVFNHSANRPNDYASVNCNYTDTVGTFCTGGTSFDTWDLTVFGMLQLGTPILLNGPYDGDTSKTWIYRRVNWNWSSLYDYSTRAYSVVGGTLDSSAVGLNLSGFPDDTLYIRWNNTVNHQINCGAPYLTTTQSFSNPWPQTCNNYEETIPAEPLHGPFPVGRDSVCPGDTVVYYTTPMAGASHSWSVIGGTILSGQNTEVVEVVWTGIPMSLTVTRTIGGNSVSGTKHVSDYQVNPASDLLPSDTNYCVGTPLVLDAGPAASWAWNTAATTQSITVNDSGTYIVSVSDIFCGSPFTISDTVVVARRVPIKPDLGPDLSFCSDTAQVFTLLPSDGFQEVYWGTSVTHNPSFSATVSGDLRVTTIDSNGCQAGDTVVLSAISPPFTYLLPQYSYCEGDSLFINTLLPNAQHTWSTGATTSSIYVSVPGQLSVITSENGCVQYDTTFVVENVCVWPGDLDYDGVADNNDVLALGAALNQNGPQRNGATLNWVGQEATDWATTQANNANVKHCDSDGNGTTNQDDTLAIALNFGLTHSKTGGTATGIPVFLVPEQDSVAPGDIAYFSLELGDAQNPATFAYGLAFSLDFDSTLVTAAGLHSVEYNNSWLGNQLLTFTYEHSTISRADLAVSRTNQVDTSGFGSIARLGFMTQQGLSGSEILHIDLSNVRLVTHLLEVENTSAQGASVVVSTAVTGLADAWTALPALEILPNPAQDYVHISLQGHRISAWELYDVNGALKERATVNRLSEFRLETGALPNGIYFVRVHDKDGRNCVGKLQIMR